MTPTESALLYFGIGLQALTFLALLFAVARRVATKDDLKRLDDRIDQVIGDMRAGFASVDARFAEQDAKFEARFAEQDVKIESLHAEMNAGFQRVDERFMKQDEKIENLRLEMKADFQRVDERFEKQDDRADNLRLELKADLQRVEDRAAEANEYHAKSVVLLDGILRQLQERREPL